MPDAVLQPDASGPATIRDLLSYRVHRLAGALSRGAALRYCAGFGVTLMEGRVPRVRCVLAAPACESGRGL